MISYIFILLSLLQLTITSKHIHLCISYKCLFKSRNLGFISLTFEFIFSVSFGSHSVIPFFLTKSSLDQPITRAFTYRLFEGIYGVSCQTYWCKCSMILLHYLRVSFIITRCFCCNYNILYLAFYNMIIRHLI